jgi:hypothetical protein
MMDIQHDDSGMSVGGGERIAAERSESASRNSFLIPTSQKVAEPRVSSGAQVKIFAQTIVARKCGVF